MTMKERIARAMCEADGLEWDDQLDPMKSSNGDDDGQQYYLAHATAALDALAEPTPEMAEAGGKFLSQQWEGDNWSDPAKRTRWRFDAKDAFSAMIKAARKQ